MANEEGPTVCSMHDVVEIINGQTTIGVCLARHTTESIFAFVAGLIPASPWQKVRCRVYQQVFGRTTWVMYRSNIPLFNSKKKPTGLPQRKRFFVSNSKISLRTLVVAKSMSGSLVG